MVTCLSERERATERLRVCIAVVFVHMCLRASTSNLHKKRTSGGWEGGTLVDVLTKTLVGSSLIMWTSDSKTWQYRSTATDSAMDWHQHMLPWKLVYTAKLHSKPCLHGEVLDVG